MDKYNAFQHLIDELLNWYSQEKNIEKNDFSILKSLKLLFFVSAASTDLGEDSLLNNIFNDFYALPYGHVESEIYDYIKNPKNNDRYTITKVKTIINQNIELPSIRLKDKKRIQDSVFILKHLNYNIIFMNHFELVELSHKWDSWKNNYVNKESLSNSVKISISDIYNESKIYS